MRYRFFFVLSFLTVIPFLILFPTEAAPVYQREVSIPPLRMSYHDLAEYLKRIRSFIEKVNGPIEFNSFQFESLELKGDDGSLSFDETYDLSQLNSIEKPIWSIAYSIMRPKAPISEVRLLFADYDRSVKISGLAPEQVDALIGMISGDFSHHSTFLGGALRRMIFVFVIAVLLPIVMGITGITRDTQALNAIMSWTLIAGSLLAMYFNIFPGVAVFPGDAAWTVRYAPQISVLGLIATVLLGILPFILPKKNRTSDLSERQ